MGSEKTKIKFWLWYGKLTFLCRLIMGNKGMRNSGLQHVAAATLAFAQTKRKACDFPTCAHTMAMPSCFVMSKYGDRPLWKKLLPSMRIYIAESEGETPPKMELAWQSYIGSLTWMVYLRFTDLACQVCEGTIQRKHGWISGVCAIWDAFPAPSAWQFFLLCCYW